MGFFETVQDNLSGKSYRKLNALKISEKLQDLGIDDPAAINKTVDNYVQTGMLVLPTTQESRVNLGDGSVKQKGRTTISDLGTTEVSAQPVRLGKKFGVYNEATGQGTMVPDLQGAGTVHTVDTPKAQRNGMIYAYTADKDGGIQVINARPTDGPDRWVRVDTKPAPAAGGARGGTGNSIQDRLDLMTIGNYQRNLASGKPISQDLLEQAVQAAQRQGLPVYETQNEQPTPGFWGGVSRLLPGGDTGMEQVNALGIGNPPGTPVLRQPAAPAVPLAAPVAPAPAPSPMTADRARAAAIQMLQEHGYPVTEKNVAAIIQRGLGGR